MTIGVTMRSVVLLLCGAVMLIACSQPLSRASVHRYTGSQSGAGSLGIHTLRSGETLWSVANAYHVDLRDMLDLNNLRAPYALHTGQRFKIPAPVTYRARPGDTLYKISRMFDTTTTELANLNHLRPPYAVKNGQILRLPSKHAGSVMMVASSSSLFSSTERNSVPIEREVLPDVTVASQKLQKTNTDRNKAIATEKTPPVALSGKGFLKPVNGRVISAFGPKADGLHNDGINIKAARGDPVRAADQGVVVYSGNQIEGYGNMILVRHANGFMTAYAHMDKNLVKKGDVVKRGQAIGTVGSSGHVDTPQLHFEIRKGKEALDPSRFV